MMRGILVFDNLFTSKEMEQITEYRKSVKMYDFLDYYNELTSKGVEIDHSFPGLRSMDLFETKSLIGDIFGRAFGRSFPFLFENGRGVEGSLYLSDRGDGVEDWIHSDPSDYTVLVYLGEDNHESGTKFYPKNPCDPTDGFDVWVRYKKNRCVVFSGVVPHMSAKNHVGRLTLNGFFTETKE